MFEHRARAQLFIQPIVNEHPGRGVGDDAASVLVVTFSDSGAHVSQIMDSSIQTRLLGHWLRERHALLSSSPTGLVAS
jgi:N-acyl-D-amino-acid deacylase